MNKWTDQTLMTSGKYKGVALANIPASWFIYMKEVYGVQRDSPLEIYITENLDVLKKQDALDKVEAKRQNKFNSR